MTILAKKWFKEREGMEPDLAKELSVPSFGIGVSEVLENFGWDGKAIAAIGLEFSPDNKKVARSHFLLRGSFTKEPVSFAANKLFPEADKDIMLHVTVPDGAEFRFPNGTTASDLVPCENQAPFLQEPADNLPHRLGRQQDRGNQHAGHHTPGQGVKCHRPETEDHHPPLPTVCRGDDPALRCHAELSLARDPHPAAHRGVLPKTPGLGRPDMPPPASRHPLRGRTQPSVTSRHAVLHRGRDAQRQAAHSLHFRRGPVPPMEEGDPRHRTPGEGTDGHLACSRETDSTSR